MTTERIFITGTDTDCGKTYVTCQLLKELNGDEGLLAFALKPVASGCQWIDNKLISEDVKALQDYNPALDLTVNLWAFEPPVSPHLAARASNQRLSVDALSEFCNDPSYNNLDYLLIEGAGGLMVPLNEEETWLDFLQHMAIPVILVVGMRLGCINHALLTDQVLHSLKIKTLGWIANCLDPQMLLLEENLCSLKDRMKMPYLGRVDFGGGLVWDGQKI